MSNLFFALRVPPAIGRELQEVRSRWDARDRDAWRWVEPQLYHLTMLFLGSRPEEQVEVLHTAGMQATADRAAFVMQARGVGAFPTSANPSRVLWAGVEDSEPLEDLVRCLEEAVRGAGLAIDSKPFKPHVTLARRRPGPQRRPPPIAEGWSARSWGEWPVQELVLLQSRLGAGPPSYQKRGGWLLS